VRDVNLVHGDGMPNAESDFCGIVFEFSSLNEENFGFLSKI
jgi:hypothetical protein